MGLSEWLSPMYLNQYGKDMNMSISRPLKTRKLTVIALAVALLSVSAMLTVPFFAIPFTMQSFAVLTVLSLLGAKAGGVAILAYLALGATGLPVFSGFTGGIGVLFGPHGGFLLGFLLAPLCFALLPRRRLLASLLSVLLYNIIGSLWYYFLFAFGSGYLASLSVTVLPFLLPDAVKLALSQLVAKRCCAFMGAS